MKNIQVIADQVTINHQVVATITAKPGTTRDTFVDFLTNKRMIDADILKDKLIPFFNRSTMFEISEIYDIIDLL